MANANHVNILGKNQEARFWFLLLIVLFITARFIFPAADPAPYKETDISWIDEGIVENARNRVLFSRWQLSESNPMYISPVFTFLEFLSFRLFGVGFFGARFISMLLGVLSLLFLYQFVNNAYDRKTAIISFILFGSNYFYLMFNRVAMLETTMVFFMVLSVWLYQRGSKSKVYLFLSGCSLTLAYFTKASAVFLVIALTIFLMLKIFVIPGLSRKEVLKECLIFFSGLTFAISLWFLFWLIPHMGDYIKYNINLYLHRNLAHTLMEVILQIASFPSANNFFIKMPIISILSLISLFGMFFSFVILKRKINEFDILLSLWIILGILQVFLTGVYARRMLFLIPPMTILTARVFVYPLDSIIPEIRSKISFFWHVFLLATYFYLTFAFCMAFVCLSPLSYNRIAISTFLTIPLFIILFKNKRIFIQLIKQISNARILPLFILISFLIDGSQFYIRMLNRSYTVIKASREIGDILPENTKVQGSIASALALENRIIPFCVCDGYANFSDMLEREDIKYILTSDEPYLGSENKAMQRLVSAYPNSKVIKRFDLHKAKGENTSVVLLEKHK